MERESCASFGGGGACHYPRALGRALYRRALASERLGRRLPSFSLSAAHGKMRGALGALERESYRKTAEASEAITCHTAPQSPRDRSNTVVREAPSDH